MSKVLNKENQRKAWNAVGYEGDPSVDVTMLDVYEWEEEFLEEKLDIREELNALLDSIEQGIDEVEAGIAEKKAELLADEEWVDSIQSMLHNILLEEGYPNGLYFHESVAA